MKDYIESLDRKPNRYIVSIDSVPKKTANFIPHKSFINSVRRMFRLPLYGVPDNWIMALHSKGHLYRGDVYSDQNHNMWIVTRSTILASTELTMMRTISPKKKLAVDFDIPESPKTLFFRYSVFIDDKKRKA